MWQDYLSKSELNLAAAERDLESGSYDPCVSRAYFSAFQAAIAALLALTDFQRRGRYWAVYDGAMEINPLMRYPIPFFAWWVQWRKGANGTRF
jgi:hypothetical protein